MNTIWNYAKAGLLAGVLAGGLAAAAPSQGRKVDTVLVEKAKELEDVVTRKYTGRVEAVQKVELQARISGNIVKTCFHEGDIVKKGQVLFEIEDTQYKANVQSAEAKLRQLEAELRYAKNNFSRYEKMEAKQVVSRDTMENSLSTMQSLEAQKIAAEAGLTNAQFDLSHTRIVSPMTGRIGRETYSEGNYVTPASEPLATIMMMDPIYVRFPLSERDYLLLFGNAEGLKKNAVLNLKLADDRIYSHAGKVAIGDNSVKSTDTINVWAEFENPNGQLTPGGIVSVILSKSEKRKLPAVLVSAVMTDEKGNYVYVLEEGDKPVRRDVKTGPMQGNYQLIEEGIKSGETVIIDGTHKVTPGTPVAPVSNY